MTLTDLEAKMLKTAQQQIGLQAREVTRLEEMMERKRSNAETLSLKTAKALEALNATKENLSHIESIVTRLENYESSLSAHRQKAEAKTQLLGQGKDPSLAREVTSFEHLEIVTEQHQEVTRDLVRARAQRSLLVRDHQAVEANYRYVLHDQMVHSEIIKGFEDNLRESWNRYRALLVVVDADNLAGYESGQDKIRRDGDATVVCVASHIHELVTSPDPVAPMQHLWVLG
ncbi:hypothetical protein MCOR25_007867 [Pyricularia grisea]|uniref:Uncharacterized protein n=1 Tax=Pyricularia grisea TaxID=148305 RepID=A0A6P8AMG5_PYRGI|nr:uncharacterized protein PgNI_12447 [Pyricularia grisea]KAI6356772.1 hypothetical protein MCOR25_007867 [Pyricularia grisea]TLD03209.1 hypothetical protein PgNI_12447 [Pyricularia grisea]